MSAIPRAPRPLNPILPGFNPDPSICRVGADYFIATSTFEFTPGVPIYHSTDLASWTLIGHALTRRSQLDLRCTEPGGGVWAPTIRYWKGRWYMTTCAVHLRYKRPIQPEGFYVWTDNIWDDNSWSDPVFFDEVGIDQDLFFDSDDTVYLTTSRFCRTGGRQLPGTKLATYAVPIDLATGRSLSTPTLLRAPPVEQRVSEGSHIVQRGGWYYLFTAEGGTGPRHHVIVSRARHVLGPYELPAEEEGVNPVVFNGMDPHVQRTGHMDVVQGEDGRWWAVMLGIRPQEGGTFQLGRETFLAPMEWPEGGWPVVNKGKPIGFDLDFPAPPKSTLKSLSWRDDFSTGILGKDWYRLRSPIKPFHSLGPAGLTLHGNAHTIAQFESPAALFRKQTAYTGVWRTELDFTPAHAWEEAGTTVFYSGDSYAAAVVRLGAAGEGKQVVLRWTCHETRMLRETAVPAPEGALVLSIKATPGSYTFTCARADTAGEEVVLGQVPAKTLDGGSETEFEMYFTGAHFGVFAQGTDGERCEAPARFRYASFETDV